MNGLTSVEFIVFMQTQLKLRVDYVRIRCAKKSLMELRALNSPNEKSPAEREEKDVYEDEKGGLGVKSTRKAFSRN